MRMLIATHAGRKCRFGCCVEFRKDFARGAKALRRMRRAREKAAIQRELK